MFRGFSSQTLAIVRQNVSVMLTDSCTIERESTGLGDMGQPLHEFEVVASDVDCRVIMAGSRTTGSNNVAGGREALTDRFRLILPVGTDISADYRVTMADGTVYDVVDVEAGLTDAAFVAAVVMRSRGRNG
jgi:head-tail adaptor